MDKIAWSDVFYQLSTTNLPNVYQVTVSSNLIDFTQRWILVLLIATKLSRLQRSDIKLMKKPHIIIYLCDKLGKKMKQKTKTIQILKIKVEEIKNLLTFFFRHFRRVCAIVKFALKIFFKIHFSTKSSIV